MLKFSISPFNSVFAVYNQGRIVPTELRVFNGKFVVRALPSFYLNCCKIFEFE